VTYLNKTENWKHWKLIGWRKEGVTCKNRGRTNWVCKNNA